MQTFEKLSFWEKRSYTEGIDFLIIGAGIVGLSAALEIKQQKPKAKVLVLERAYLPNGASTKNAGFACIGSPSELLDDLKHQSETEVFATVEKRYRGLQKLREKLGDQQLRYQALGAYEIFSASQKKLFQNCCENLDYLNAQLKPICGHEQTFKLEPKYCKNAKFKGFEQAISHAAEAQLEPDYLMQALAQKASTAGVLVLYGIEVSELNENEVETKMGKIGFEKAAICTNGLASQFLGESVKPARAQVVVTSPLPEIDWQGIHHFDQGYYYFRNIGNRVLLGGGRNLDFAVEETNKMETTARIQDELFRLLKEEILAHQNFQIDYQWAGIMGVGESKKPMLKSLSPSLYCAIRLGGMGVAIGTLVGEELAEMMLK
ncbi:MAG: FAD-dependent oxidoreductase [Vicingaceae bacterium]